MDKPAMIVVAAVLTWLILAFIVRTILSSTTHTYRGGLVGEVERGMLVSAGSEGKVSKVGCHRQTSNVWRCQLRFADGRIVIKKAAWYKSQHTFGISVVSSN